MHSVQSALRRYGIVISVAAALLIIFVAFVAIADIVSGAATSNISSNVTITRLSLDRPAVTEGTVMLASITINGGGAVSVTAPSGWTQIARTDNDVNVTLISYWKVVSASEPTTYTWSMDQQTRAVGGIVPYTGVDGTNPIDAVAGNIGLGTTATTSVVTTAAANEEIAALFATDVTKTFSSPTGMTQKFSVSNGSLGPTELVSDTIQAASGSSGSKSSVISGGKARSWSSQIIALRRSVPAITFDNAAGVSSFAATNTVSMPLTVGNGANRMLIVGILVNPPAPPYDIVSGVSYGSVQATLLSKTFYSSSQGPEEIYLYALPSPTSGTANVVTTFTTSDPGFALINAASYTGVDQNIPTNVASNIGTGLSLTVPLTVANAGAWVTGFMGNNSACMSLQAPGVVRRQDNCGILQFDAVGTQNVEQTFTSILIPEAVDPAWGGIAAELKPAL